jgi:heme-degrading monooxygenase HmoA
MAMQQTLIRHKVKDYAKWKPVFDEDSATRKAAGEKGGQLFRNKDDQNEIIIMFKWDTMEHARKFFESEDLKKIMKKAGVIDKPDIYFLEEVETV